MTDRADSVARTRRDIIDAALEIGDLRAPLGVIADRAGISERTVLRHFGDRSGLFAAVLEEAERQISEERFTVPPGDIDGAVGNLVSHYERRGDEVVARLAQEGTDERVDRVLASGRDLHRRWVQEKLGPCLPKLSRADRRRRLAQLVAVCDVYTWKLLRRDQGLGVEETRKAIAELIRATIKEGNQ